MAPEAAVVESDQAVSDKAVADYGPAPDSRPHVMLRRNWEGTFRRSVRDKSGKILRVLVFSPGQVVAIEPEDIPSIKGDLGHALTAMEWNREKGKFERIDLEDVDPDATAKGEEKAEENGTGTADPAPEEKGSGTVSAKPENEPDPAPANEPDPAPASAPVPAAEPLKEAVSDDKTNVRRRPGR